MTICPLRYKLGLPAVEISHDAESVVVKGVLTHPSVMIKACLRGHT